MNEPGFEPLFDGVSLTGWSAIPRHYGQLYPGGPGVLDVNTGFPRDYNSRADAHPAAWRSRTAPSSGARSRRVGVRRVLDLRPRFRRLRAAPGSQPRLAGGHRHHGTAPTRFVGGAAGAP